MSDFLVVPSQQPNTDYMLAWYKYGLLVYTHTWKMWLYFIGLSKIKTVDSAQPRNHSVVTWPVFSWEVGSGHNRKFHWVMGARVWLF